MRPPQDKAGTTIFEVEFDDEIVEVEGPSNWTDAQAQAAAVASRPQQPERQQPSWGDVPVIGGATANDALGVVKGAGMGLMDTIQTGGQWLEDLPRQVRQALSGQQLPSSVSPMRTTPTGRDPFEPRTTQERVGKVLGKAGIGAGAAVATGGASLPVQVGVGGLTGATLDPESPYIGAGLGMGAPLVSRVAGAFSKGAKTKAEELVTSTINPQGNADKAALKKVIGPIAAEKPFAWSSEGLQQQFANKADEAATLIDDLIDTIGQGQRIVNPNAVASKIDPVIDALKDPNTGKIITVESQQMAKELGRIKAEIRAVGGKSGGTTLESLRKLKQDYREIIKTGQAQNFNRILPHGSRAAAARDGYAAAQEGMIDAAPELAGAGQDYHRLALVRDLLAKNEIRGSAGQRSPVGSIVKTGMALAGHPGKALALHGAMKATGSTPFKLGSAAGLSTLGDALGGSSLNPALTGTSQMIEQVRQELSRNRR